MIQEAIDKYVQQHKHEINLKAVLFDMDGVLFDSMRNHSLAWHQAMLQFGMHLSREEAYLHEGRTGAGTIQIISRRERGIDATDEEIQQIYQCKSNLFNALPKPEPMIGAAHVLQQVKQSHLEIMLVTGSGQHSLIDKLNHHYPGYFEPDKMITAYDVKHGKPNPEPYLMALQKLRLQPHEAIVIENAPLGVEAGCAAGIFTIAVNTGPIPDQVLLDAGAHLLFPSMTALAENWEHLFRVISEK